MKKNLFVTLIFLITSLVAAQEIKIYVSIAAQKEAVEKIAQDKARVEVLLPTGQSPENYSPAPRIFTQLRDADAIFFIGVEFEKSLQPRLKKIFGRKNADKILYDVRQGMKFRQMEAFSSKKQVANDPHVWLDPENMIVYAKQLEKFLAEKDPVNQEFYQNNYENYAAELKELKKKIEIELAEFRGAKVIVVHPAFGYFFDICGIEQLAIEKGGREPGARHLKELLETAEKEKVKIIFTQPQFSSKTALALNQYLKGEILSINPLPEEYSKGIEEIIDIIGSVKNVMKKK